MCGFPSKRRRLTGVCEVCAVTVGAHALTVDWDDTTCFHDQTQDSTHSGQVLLPQEVSQVRGKLDVSPRVLTRTLCIPPSESISLGLPHRRRQAWSM